MRNKYFVLFSLLIPLFCGFFLVQNVSAIRLNTLPWYMFTSNAGSTSQITNGPFTNFGSGTSVENRIILEGYSNYDPRFPQVNGISVISDSVSTTGNYATLNWEFNIVAQNITAPGVSGRFFKDAYITHQTLNVCQFNDVNRQIKTVDFSTSVTNWTTPAGYNAQTLTVYLSAVCEVPSNTSGKFLLQFNAPTQPRGIYQGNSTAQPFAVFVEKSELDVIFTNDESEALLQTQVQQNNIIIGQNEQIISSLQNQSNQDQQDRDDVQSVSDSGQDNADASQQQNEQATSTLLSVIGSFIQALGAPASDCQIRTDLGNIDLGTLDFCAGKPAELTPIINTVCAMVMCIPIYLIAKDLFRRFVYITTFAQGGEYK